MSETYTIGGDALYLLQADHIAGQTFSPVQDHLIQYIDLNLHSSLFTAPPRVQIYLTNHLNEPTGDPLVNIYIYPPSPLIPSVSRVRVKIPSPFLLSKGTEYALLCLYELPIIGTRASWEYDLASATYPRGHRIHSDDGGATWTHELGSDHIFCEFGDPPLPKPEPEPPIIPFAIPAISYIHFETGLIISLITSVPCHLTCYYTDKKPLKHHTTRTVRGLTVPWGTYFCFVAWKTKEQIEPGDTLYHTFKFAEWPVCSTIKKTWDLEHGALPPYWEPWGNTLTENNPWEQYYEDDPIEYELVDGVIHLFNPAWRMSGIICGLLPTGIPLLSGVLSPLYFHAKGSAIPTTDPADYYPYLISTWNGVELYTLELLIARGDGWGPWGTFKVALGNRAGIDYGEDPGPFNLLEFWQWARRKIGKSDDPRGWVIGDIHIASEHTSPPDEVHIHNDFINFFHPTRQKDVSYGNERYFTFRGEVDNVQSPSVGPIFKHCHPGTFTQIEEQPLYDGLDFFLPTRKKQGQRLTIPGRVVGKIAFVIERHGAGWPGDLSFAIRKVSDDSIIATKVWGPVAIVPTVPTWLEVTLDTPVYVNEEVRLTAEWPTAAYGRTKNLRFHLKTSDVKASEVYTKTDSGVWGEPNPWDAAYRYTYRT